MLSYSADQSAPSARIGYWEDVMFSVYGAAWKLEPAVAKRDFCMQMHAYPFGDLMLTNASLSQARIQQDRHRGVDSGRYTYSIYIVNQRQRITMGDTHAVLEAGDFTLFDTRRASSIVTEKPYSILALAMPAEFLHQYLPDPEEVVGRRFDGQSGLSAAAAALFHSLWDLAETGQLMTVGNTLSRNFLELFATSFLVSNGGTDPKTKAMRDRRAHVDKYLDENLRDPSLSVSRIATECGMSTRSLQALFAAGGDTLSGYIRRNRLEGCRQQLVDPVWRGRGITEIAFAWGFNDATHFARVFRETFGLSAREYRCRHRISAGTKPPSNEFDA